MSETVTDILHEADSIAKELLLEQNFKPLEWADEKWEEFRDTRAVYIIKENNVKFYGGKVFYVGKSTRLGQRLVNHCRGDSNLSNKLGKHLTYSAKRITKHRDGTEEEILSYTEIDEYLNTDCVFSIRIISDFDMLSLVEMLLIKFYRSNGCQLLNESKK